MSYHPFVVGGETLASILLPAERISLDGDDPIA
jgi:hypothetical protein